MKKITQILKEKDFTISLELIPPKNGISLEKIYNLLEKIKNKLDFVSVTKGAGGSLRGGSLPISYFCQSKFGINTISHFVCRERTKYELENDLIDLHHFGIKNILALRGDPPAGSNEVWNGDYKYAYLLVEQMKNMNKGLFFSKNIDKNRINTDFCIIVAGHPEDPVEQEIKHMKIKINAGAEAIITQMIFSFNEYDNYSKELKRNGINLPIIAGIRPLTTYEQALSIENFFKLKVPEVLKKGLKEAKNAEEARKFGIEYFSEMIKKLKESKAPGIHLFIFNEIELVDDLIKNIRSS